MNRVVVILTCVLLLLPRLARALQSHRYSFVGENIPAGYVQVFAKAVR